MSVESYYDAAIDNSFERAQRINFLDYFATRPDVFKVQASVLNEAASLIMHGSDVEIVDVYDDQALTGNLRSEVDELADKLTVHPEGAEMFRKPPAMQRWAPLTKRAIALHPLYGANRLQTLGDGIRPDVYDAPIFTDNEGNKRSAKDILFAEKRPEKAAEIYQNHVDFVNEPIDNLSRMFYRGSRDGEAIRSRAILATDLVVKHFMQRRGEGLADHSLTSASLACGAAGPVYKLVKRLEDETFNVGEVILVDKDEMALASAYSLAESTGVVDKIKIERQDLFNKELTDYIKPKSVDVVDLLGLFEYVPNSERFGMLATQLLKRVKEIVRPGGMIVFGNMLADRDQQEFFEHVVKWPPLQQRKMQEVLSIIESAGYKMSDVKTRVSATDGVYAVYAVSVPVDRLNRQ